MKKLFSFLLIASIVSSCSMQNSAFTVEEKKPETVTVTMTEMDALVFNLIDLIEEDGGEILDYNLETGHVNFVPSKDKMGEHKYQIKYYNEAKNLQEIYPVIAHEKEDGRFEAYIHRGSKRSESLK